MISAVFSLLAARPNLPRLLEAYLEAKKKDGLSVYHTHYKNMQNETQQTGERVHRLTGPLQNATFPVQKETKEKGK